MPVRINLTPKEGYQLNPDNKLVNAIVRAIGESDGHCMNRHIKHRGCDICPCDEYLLYNNCMCKLYVKSESKEEK